MFRTKVFPNLEDCSGRNYISIENLRIRAFFFCQFLFELEHQKEAVSLMIQDWISHKYVPKEQYLHSYYDFALKSSLQILHQNIRISFIDDL